MSRSQTLMMGKVSMATYKFYVDESWNVYVKDSEGYWFSVWGFRQCRQSIPAIPMKT